jgi:hypothetical protein
MHVRWSSYECLWSESRGYFLLIIHLLLSLAPTVSAYQQNSATRFQHLCQRHQRIGAKADLQNYQVILFILFINLYPIIGQVIWTTMMLSPREQCTPKCVLSCEPFAKWSESVRKIRT